MYSITLILREQFTRGLTTLDFNCASFLNLDGQHLHYGVNFTWSLIYSVCPYLVYLVYFVVLHVLGVFQHMIHICTSINI